MGRTRMTVGETLELRQGSIITLNRMAGEPVDLLVNGTPIARGEVVVIDEQFGLRVTEVLGSSPIGESANPRPAPPARAEPPPPRSGPRGRRPRRCGPRNHLVAPSHHLLRREALKLHPAADEYLSTESH